MAIFEFLWQDSEELTALGTRTEHSAPRPARAEVRGPQWLFEGPGRVDLGRDGGCDIVVGDRKASRQHARIERRRDKFVLVDHSSNGTWVRFAGEAEEVVLRREELMLRASGLIGLGHSPTDGEGTPVAFTCS